MMKQPYLGKKIIELRKLKGLTQVDLEEKCNITIRTLQRIESGKVTPRYHTIREISKALDYDFSDKESMSLQEKGSILLEQIKKYIIDLLNLKTNTMKKLSILSIPFILISVSFLLSSYNSNAQRRISRKLIGTWQMCKADSTVANNLYNKSVSKYKVVTNDSFIVFEVGDGVTRDGATFWGTYGVKKHVYTEFIQFAGSGYRYILGNRNSFKIKIKKDLMFIEGTNNNFKEIWKKVED